MSEKKPLKRVLILVPAAAFFGSTGYGFVSMFRGAANSEQAATSQATAEEQQLQQRERGFELVVAREPDNETALQGLVQARLEMNDLEGAIAPLEKLVELNPEQAEYKVLLATLKQQAGESEGIKGSEESKN
jgi:cytochrome c-type biogenesis protein CcmH/NrfG